MTTRTQMERKMKDPRAAIIVVILLTPGMAGATAYRSANANKCQGFDLSTQLGTSGNVAYGTLSGGPSGQTTNVSTGLAEGLLCPIASDSQISTQASTVSVTLFGYKNGGTSSNLCNTSGTQALSAQACRAYAQGSGGICGASATPSLNHTFALALDTTAYLSGGTYSPSNQDGYFIFVYLGCEDSSGSQNGVWSYVLGN